MTAQTVTECPVDWCGPHPEHEGRCMVGIEDTDGREGPCGCSPCPDCFLGVIIVREYDGLEYEQSCLRCDGSGQA